MNNPKIVLTAYNGYRFKNRLQARWAVFLDSLGVLYQYEMDAFDMGDAPPYAPCFWLPQSLFAFAPKGQQGVWVDVKNGRATPEDERRCQALARMSGHPVFLFDGGLPSGNYISFGADASGFFPFVIDADPLDNKRWAQWAECPTCGFCDIAWRARVADLACDCLKIDIEGTFNEETGEDSRQEHRNVFGPRLKLAYRAARQSHFEYTGSLFTLHAPFPVQLNHSRSRVLSMPSSKPRDSRKRSSIAYAVSPGGQE